MSQGFTAHLCVDFSFLSCLSLLPAGGTLGPGSSPVQVEMEGYRLASRNFHQTAGFFPPLNFRSLWPSLAALRRAEGKHLFIRVVSLNKALGASAGLAVLAIP